MALSALAAAPLLAEAPAACDSSPAGVIAVVEGLIAADNRRDLEKVVATYTEDVVFLTPTGEAVSGRPAVRERYGRLFSDFVPQLAVQVAEAHADREWAFVRGVTQGELRPAGGGGAKRLDDNFLMILHCEPGGAWKVARLMWSPRPAAGS